MIEMKKMIKFAGIALIFAALLSACSNAKNNTQKKAETAAQSSTIEASDSNENEPNTENITQAVKQLEEKFNSDEKLVKIDVKNNVKDDTSDNPHAVITVKVINDEAKKYGRNADCDRFQLRYRGTKDCHIRNSIKC